MCVCVQCSVLFWWTGLKKIRKKRKEKVKKNKTEKITSGFSCQAHFVDSLRIFIGRAYMSSHGKCPGRNRTVSGIKKKTMVCKQEEVRRDVLISGQGGGKTGGNEKD